MGLPRRYDPFGIRRMHEEMDELFEELFEQSHGRSLIIGFRAPLCEIEEKADMITVTAEMPGLEKEDIRITVDKGNLSISAERKQAREEKKGETYYSERRYAGFKRTFRLPAEIDPGSVEAEYKEGILKIMMKKSERETEKKEVKIK